MKMTFKRSSEMNFYTDDLYDCPLEETLGVLKIENK